MDARSDDGADRYHEHARSTAIELEDPMFKLVLTVLRRHTRLLVPVAAAITAAAAVAGIAMATSSRDGQHHDTDDGLATVKHLGWPDHAGRCGATERDCQCRA